MTAGGAATHAYCVCVPARNEAARLPRLLDALAAQDVSGRVSIVVALNNCSDDSEEVVAECADRHAGRLDVACDVVVFPPEHAHAGSARRRAMDLGAARLSDRADAVLISTDADARPPRNWIRCNLEAIGRGADIVGGRLELDDAEEASAALTASRTVWDRYWAQVREIEDALDPRSDDPMPRHGDHTGASLAVTARAYREAGGVPVRALGEDRALVDAVVAGGGRLVHPMDVWTRVSPRLSGRAEGGMAAVMRDWDRGDGQRAPAFHHWRERAIWRRETRSRIGVRGLIEAEAALPPLPLDLVLIAGRAAAA